MNSKKTKDIERLMQRFFDGETTTEEEARLYRVFRRKRLPHSLERMRPVMEAFGSMEARAPRRAMTASIVRRALAGAAAVLALAVGTAVYSDYREEQSLARLYGGSYIIENGRRTDNLRAIHDDIERTLADSRRIEKRAGQKRDRPRGAGCARQHIRP